MDSTDATRSGPHRLRTSDTEREQVAVILRAAMTEGRLNLAEGEERLASAYAASYRDELTPLTADLPDGGRRALAETPQARSALRRHQWRQAAWLLMAAALLTGLWTISGAHFFWPAIPLTILVLRLFRHAAYGRYERRFHHYGPRAFHHGRVAHRHGSEAW